MGASSSTAAASPCTRSPTIRTAAAAAAAHAREPGPPYLVKRAPSAGPGLNASLLGSVRRADGTTQVLYAGRPLYYYVGDRKAGQVLCQGVSQFGGRWLVVRANGTPVP